MAALSDRRIVELESAGLAGALRQLFWLRNVAIVAQAALVAIVHVGLGSSLPVPELALTVAALALWNALNFRAVHAPRRIEPGEVSLNLVVDVVAFTSLIYFTGGPTNPFVSLYLVPISLAAISLPKSHAWFIATLCGAGYTALWWRHVPLPPVHTRFGGAFDLHLVGMWVNFVIAAVLIVLFVGRLTRLLQVRDRELSALREQALRDQQVVELGALAAGTAHELNTPLSTLAILVDELDDTTTDAAQKQHLRAMAEELQVINERLTRIAGGVGAERSAGATRIGLRAFLNQLLARWAAAHPDIDLETTFDLPMRDLTIAAEATLEHAIRNVLDNAAHATRANGARRVELAAQYRDTALELRITDLGAGLQPEVRDEIGLRVLTTKDRGLGIGLLLSRAAIQRFGGKLDLADRSQGGVEACIHLPLGELLADGR